ncbi:nucleoside diphosphate kinase regulator [Alcanivorax sp. JB21]|uniref:nucleoside diphosphate kinase regulator n=1 Tax=Alcanivorax limicola TaxID=2874102 RepID=UPI001CC01754|nr:nucleoside diphosphate kinase regulator [Alcanivorax limicola]MBZ2189734.1 nucleoside diphosphate kinase regulator [Alcanivorax limicola]
MNLLPAITVSTTDRDRLFAVLDNFKGDSDQIDYLYDELARANIVDENDIPEGVVTLGSRARFRNDATGKEHERVLTLPGETQTVSDAISILTPAGAALLGLKTGDDIQWPHEGHFLHLRLLNVTR